MILMSAAPGDVITQAITPNVFVTPQQPCGINEVVATVRACIGAL